MGRWDLGFIFKLQLKCNLRRQDFWTITFGSYDNSNNNEIELSDIHVGLERPTFENDATIEVDHQYLFKKKMIIP